MRCSCGPSCRSGAGWVRLGQRRFEAGDDQLRPGLKGVGIGLIFPILPSLLEDLTGSSQVSTTHGLILAAYAAMQFVFSPILGVAL